MHTSESASGNDLTTSDSRLPAPGSMHAQIEALDRQTFVERLGFLFEGSPWIAAEAWDSRPWRPVMRSTRRCSRSWRAPARSANSP